jgi:hypothetical protein
LENLKQTHMQVQGRVHQWSNRVFSLLFLIGETMHFITSVLWAKRRKSLWWKQRHSNASYLLDVSYCLSFNQCLFGNALIAHNILIDASVGVTGWVYFIIMVLIQ